MNSEVVAARVGSGTAFTYAVLEVVEDGVRLAPDGEAILGPDGKPVTGVAILLGGNRCYTWQRSDWSAYQVTAVARLCDPPN